jgi:hypothetical protein
MNVQAGEVEDEIANERRDCERYGKEATVERLDNLHLRREQAEENKIFPAVRQQTGFATANRAPCTGKWIPVTTPTRL